MSRPKVMTYIDAATSGRVIRGRHVNRPASANGAVCGAWVMGKTKIESNGANAAVLFGDAPCSPYEYYAPSHLLSSAGEGAWLDSRESAPLTRSSLIRMRLGPRTAFDRGAAKPVASLFTLQLYETPARKVAPCRRHFRMDSVFFCNSVSTNEARSSSRGFTVKQGIEAPASS